MDYSNYPADAVKNHPAPPTAPPAAYYGGHQPPAQGVPVPPHNVRPPPPPAAHHVHGGVPGPWSTGLCDCFSDVSNCCITCWCPCITFGQIAEIVDRGSTSCGVTGGLYALISLVTGCGCLYSCFYRSKMRKQYMLPETSCGDCMVHFCCEACALCQEYRELKHRGFDMSIGWEANVERQNQGVGMAPFVHGGMSR
ncbi:hypothetical protein ABFS83_05G045400 [Erythranthe nasuta]